MSWFVKNVVNFWQRLKGAIWDDQAATWDSNYALWDDLNSGSGFYEPNPQSWEQEDTKNWQTKNNPSWYT